LDKLAVLNRLLRPSKTIIFDFDGLLADSEKYHYISYRAVFSRYGHHLNEKEYYKYWTSLGHGARGEVERHNLDLDWMAIRREKQPIFTRYCEDGSIRLYQEADEMIDILHGSGRSMVIASGTASGDILAVLRNAGKADLFDLILGSDIVPVMKPAPDILLKVLEKLDRLAARECLVIEDAEKGMIAAKEAGIPVAIIRTPETQDFDFDLADLVLDSHAEMLRLLKTLFPASG
jgi:HAD superfamily hydrolase (TIGR01509 family)